MKKTLRLKTPKGKRKIELKDQEHLEIFLEDFETGSRSFQLEIILHGTDARCSVKGRIQATGNDQKKWEVVQQCLGIEPQVYIDFHGVAEALGELEFEAQAIIEKTSQRAHVEVIGNIWLLGEGKGRSTPILDVLTEDILLVHHTASVAPIEPQKILFLTARGINEETAKNILKKGFLRL